MYNDLTRELLRQVKFEDGIILAEQTKYSVSDSHLKLVRKRKNKSTNIYNYKQNY